MPVWRGFRTSINNPDGRSAIAPFAYHSMRCFYECQMQASARRIPAGLVGNSALSSRAPVAARMTAKVWPAVLESHSLLQPDVLAGQATVAGQLTGRAQWRDLRSRRRAGAGTAPKRSDRPPIRPGWKGLTIYLYLL
jgi:hypothetical protein